MLFPFPLDLFPFPSWAVWLFPFPWDSHGNGIPMGFPTHMHTSTLLVTMSFHRLDYLHWSDVNCRYTLVCHCTSLLYVRMCYFIGLVRRIFDFVVVRWCCECEGFMLLWCGITTIRWKVVSYSGNLHRLTKLGNHIVPNFLPTITALVNNASISRPLLLFFFVNCTL